ncbi:MAG: hypothetical protein JSU70_15805 [Phycisphaerales bacterium]|nr:MAG: hypothetical protein JSU70_15805 [Phycisphaerales bacterium]
MTCEIRATGSSRSLLAVFVCVVAGLPLGGIGQAPAGASVRGNDVTLHIENLGSPFLEMRGSGLLALYRRLARGKCRDGEWIYARNIWDMHVYDGRVYLGAGNSSNFPPAVNAGPVPIVCYDPVKENFLKEGTVDDEQIDVYYTHGGRLYIPGHDPTRSWKLGNFYLRRNNGRWKEYRNIPGAIHTYAMAWHEGKVFGGLGIHDSAAVSISADEGHTWTIVRTGGCRVHGFLAVAGGLYAVEMVPTIKKVERWRESLRANFLCVSEFESPDRFIPRRDITAKTLFPTFDSRSSRWMKVIRAQALGDKTLYIGAYCHNDHQSLPFGLFLASSLERGNPRVRPIVLPDGSRPWDWVPYDGQVYVLVEAEAAEGARVKVLRSHAEDLHAWEEVLHFDAPTFARSFEILDGDFYFGLGCKVDDPPNWKQEELHPATGDILRVKAEFVK